MSKCKTINLFIRSLIFAIFSISSYFIYGCVLFLLIYISPLRIRYKFIRCYLRFYLWILEKICHISYEIHGLENIPKNRTGIILSKHQSTWETFLLPIIFPDPAIILKQELLWMPFFGWGLRASDPIAINRNNKASAMHQIINQGNQCLNQGRWILIFPEGTRVPYKKVGHYKLGGARLAVATHHPVIPVAHNAGKYWPRREFIKQPGRIKVVIGPLIETTDKTPEEVLSLTKNWIETTMRSIE